MNSKQHVERFLAERKSTLYDVCQIIGSVREDESLAIVGSVVEGFGTKRSDLDLAIFSSRPLDPNRGRIFDWGFKEEQVFFAPSGLRLGLERYKESFIVESGRRLRHMEKVFEYSDFKDGTMLGPVPLDLGNQWLGLIDNGHELNALHRIRVAYLISESNVALTNIRETIRAEFLAQYMTYIFFVLSMFAANKFSAQVKAGNSDVALLTLRRSVSCLAAALCASHGNTAISSERWRVHALNNIATPPNQEVINNLRRLWLDTNLEEVLSAATIDTFRVSFLCVQRLIVERTSGRFLEAVVKQRLESLFERTI